ncbi:protein PXR1-like isoform X2 [Malus sylvestris]|uniref:protein PXR1-like isoform X2 n=1 Tax=Malus sylvestris TaxID=3752 RepID=UPI0021ACDC8A|nr:protein PXR1-like isoform X2 [Malus sylvestris]
MGMKDKKKTHKSKKAALPNLDIVEKDEKLGSAEMRKRKRAKESDADSRKVVQVSIEDNSAKPAKDKKKTKLMKKRKVKNAKNYAAVESENDHPNTETDDDFNEIKDDGVADQSPFETQEEIEIGEVLTEAGKSKKAKKKKKKDRNPLEFVKSLEKEVEAGQESSSRGISSVSKKALKKKKRDLDSSESTKTMETEVEVDQADVYLISSGDEESSKGMKKWVTEYHQSRPGLKELQQRIDQFMVEHDEKLEQEKKEKEARAAEGGWTVVVHHKGRKKTTDAESGITVGSVAQAALEDKVAKKKHTEVVGLDFYRFQRKEAQRNEIMMLQSKFEQDKKRIQQLRAARKFRPY